jgi:putative ABC transport system permease protein
VKPSQLRVVTTIARRNVRRNAARSSLIVAMVALPVALVVAGAGIARTAIPDAEEKTAGVMGAADLLVSPGEIGPDGLARRLPRGSEVLTIRGERVSAIRDGKLVEVSIVEPDRGLTSPLARGLYRLESGRAPREEGEVALHPDTLDAFDTRVGGRVTLGDLELTVTGVALEPQDLDRAIAVVGPGTLSDDASIAAALVGIPARSSDTSLSAELTKVVEATVSRTETLASNAKSAAMWDMFSVVSGTLALFGVGLVAAAAFIVGAHRQLRGLGILLAAGGEPRHARAVVLFTGTTLGLAGSAIGVVAGLGLARAVHPYLDALAGRVVGAPETSVVAVVGGFLMGTLAATLAAYAPARMAGKLTVNDALASRRPPPRPPRRLAGRGVVVFGAGGVATAWGMSNEQAPTVAIGLMTMLLGIFLVIPLMVSFVGRIASALPVAGRVAARDAARHGTRTGAAIAAAIVALALPVVIATYSLSEERHDRKVPHLDDGQLLIGTLGDFGEARADDLRTELEESFPTARMVPLSKATDPSAVDADGGAPAAWAFGISRASEPETISGADLFVGDEELLVAVRAEGGGRALAEGKAVVLGGFEPVKGAVRVTAPVSPKESRVPAVAVASPSLANESIPTIVVSPETAEDLGLRETTREYLLAAPAPFSASDLERARETAAAHPGFYTKSADDYLPPYDVARAGSLAASIPLALAVLAVVVALVVAESRRSHQILVAVGASPATHRKIVAATAALLASIASILAVPAGLFPTWMVQAASSSGRPLAIPWATIAVVVVCTPVLSGLLAGAVSRSPKLGSLLRLAD